MSDITWQPPEQNTDWVMYEDLVADGWPEEAAFVKATTLRFPLNGNATAAAGETLSGDPGRGRGGAV